jgi:ABC-type dipeptide/oligopeptide/nickel transport system permease component
LAFLLLTLLVVSFLVFSLNELSPGGTARKILGAYAVPSAPGTSESGRLCHGDGGHEWGARRRRALMLSIL